MSTLSEKYINFPINFLDILSATLLACLLSILVKFVYSFKHNDNASDWRLQDQFYLLGPIISIIMLFIGSNLALSIGLVGSLSIIRFRSAIKSPMDLIYLLWVISIGLGCGTLNFIHITSATFVITAIVLIKKLFEKNNDMNGISLLAVSGDVDRMNESHLYIKKHFDKSKLLTTNLVDNSFDSTFHIHESVGIHKKVLELKKSNNLNHVSIINNDSIQAK